MYIWIVRTREAAIFYAMQGISGNGAFEIFFGQENRRTLFFGLALFFSLSASLKLGCRGQKFLAFAAFIGPSGPITFFAEGDEERPPGQFLLFAAFIGAAAPITLCSERRTRILPLFMDEVVRNVNY